MSYLANRPLCLERYPQDKKNYLPSGCQIDINLWGKAVNPVNDDS